MAIAVLDNDTDPNPGDGLTVTAVTQPAGGSAAIGANGTVAYTPDPATVGTDTFTYTVSDGAGGTATAAVTVTVANGAPVARADAGATQANVPVDVAVLANDRDPNGDPLTVLEVGAAADGTVQIVGGGTGVRYTPRPGFEGGDTFTYTIGDGRGGRATASVSITVTANDPIAADDTVTAPSATGGVTVPVLANDLSPSGGTLTVTSVGSPAGGSARANPDGTVTYTPNGSFIGVDRFSYTISDGAGGTARGTVSVTVPNAPPVAVVDTASTGPGTAVTIPVLDNDSDPNGDPLRVVSDTQPSGGTVVANPDGTLTFTPTPSFVGTTTFAYTIADGRGGTDSATVSVTVVNGVPVAVDDAASTGPATPVAIPVLDNDADPNGDALSVSPADGANGTTTADADGVVTYTPVVGFKGTDTFSYTIRDGRGGSATAQVTVQVANAAPIARDDQAFTQQAQPVTIGVLGDDTDPNGDPLSVQSVSQPANGTAAFAAAADGTVTYTPDPAFVGTDTFTYVVSDGDGGTDVGTVTVTVAGVAPRAVDDLARTPVFAPVTLDVLANDANPGGQLRVVALSDPASGTAVIDDAGTVTYTPAQSTVGTVTFTYTVEGPGGQDTGLVTVVVANAPPVGADDPDVTTPANTPVTFDPRDNDEEPNGDDLEVIGFTDPDGGVVREVDGTLTYTPNPGFKGEDTFTYTVSDPQGATDTAVVTVTVGNAAPVAVDDQDETAAATPVEVDVLANDSDPNDDPLEVTAVTQPSDGAAELTGDGIVTYTPDPGHKGPDTFTYTVGDGDGGTDTAEVTVVTANAAPVAVEDTASTGSGQAVTVPVTGNDTDPNDDPLTVTASGVDVPPRRGTVTVGPGPGQVTYTPAAGAKGLDTFTYQIGDGDGGTDIGLVTVTIANAPPVAVDDAATTPAATEVRVDVRANDSDANDDPLTETAITQPANGTASITPGGRVAYTPAVGFKGADTLTYTTSDGDGGTATATLTVTVGNAPPVAVGDEAGTELETPVDIDVLANDSDPNDEDPLTVAIVDGPANGTAVVDADGIVVYTPDDGFGGTDTCTYSVSDGDGGTAVGPVTVTVANAAPTAIDDAEATPGNTAVTAEVLANDTDPNGDPLTVVDETQGTDGSVRVNADGTVTYTPAPGFKGTDEFTYTISDGNGGTDTATVSVTVANLPPAARPDQAAVPSNESVTIQAVADDNDPNPGDTALLRITDVSTPSRGTVTVVPDRDGMPDRGLRYEPGPGDAETVTFTYTISDGDGGTATTTVTVLVDAVAPLAVDDFVALLPVAQQSVVVDVLDNDQNPGGGQLTVESVGPVTGGGTATADDDGTVTYTKAPTSVGEVVFDYTIANADGQTSTAQVTIVVENAPPVAQPDQVEVAAGTPTNVDPRDNDSDPNVPGGDPAQVLEIVGFTEPAGGVVREEPDGSLTYTPRAGFKGTDTFTYTVADADRDTATRR